MRYNALIIGAGNIGAFFDNPESERILTHAHAFTSHKGFDLVGFVDINGERAQKAAEIWGCESFKDIGNAFCSGKIDIAVVAVPDDYHYIVLKELSNYPLKVILAEKPLTKTLKEAEEILKIFSGKKTDIVVNYTRRFVPEFENIKNDIIKGAYGEYLTGTGYYGKGIVHNGSHLIDLLRYFIGEIDRIMPVCSILDFFPDDESISAALVFENNKPFFLQYTDCRKYTIFEMDLLFEKKRIRILDSGLRLEEYDVQDSTIFNGYKNIIKTNEIDTALHNALFYAVENIYKHLTEEQNLKCNINDGYKTLQTSIKIRESVKR